ncbi:hypothetical protein V2W45_1498187 [Cenococcum geophilum]
MLGLPAPYRTPWQYCLIAYYKGDTSKIPLVIKDLWQYLECKKEGELLRKAAEKGVINMARYYYHGTIYIGAQDNDIFNIYKGLDITKAINYKPKSLIVPLNVARVTNRKRSSSYTNAPLPLNKRLSLAIILTALKGSIKGYKSLYTIRAFIAIGVLLGKKYSFRYDLESFF